MGSWSWRTRLLATGRTAAVLGMIVLVGLNAAASASAQAPGVAPTEPTLEAEPKPLRELPELRSEDSNTYLLSNGAHALKIYDHPVNFRSGDGAWQPIEDQLVQQADGSWSPQASPTPISLPASLGSGAVAVGSGSRAISFQLEGAAEAEGAPAGAQHIYRGALPDTSVTYTAAPQAVRETLTLSSADAPTVFRYRLNLASGLHASLSGNGSVLVEDAQGATIYTITPPSASDADPDRPFPSRSAVHYELSEGGSVLSLVLDRSWLNDPNRLFPVTIDPEVWFSTTKDCAIISAGFANNDECGAHLYVGPDSPNPSEGIARSLLYFDTSSVPKGSAIVASYLRLHLSWDTTSEPITVEAHALTRSFTSGVTWNRYDGTGSWTTGGGDFSKSVAGERVDNHAEVGEDLRFGFTPQVEQWVRDSSSNHGVLLKAKDETKAGYDAFAQSGNAGWEPEPGLEVIYEPRLGIPPMGQVYQQPLANGGTMSVNVANGNLNVLDPDVNYSSEGYDTELGRSYNSLDDLVVGASFGDWRLTKGDDPKLYRYSWDGTNTFYSPDGGDTRFDRAKWADGHPAAGDKAFTGEAGFNEGLVEHEGGTRTLSFPDGSEWKFNEGAWGEAAEIVEPNGEGNTLSLTYSEGRLTKLKDTHEHSITLSRNGSHDVTKLVGKLGEEWKYEYSSGRLTKYNAPGGVEVKYGYYETSGLLKYITDSSGTWVISYDEQNRVSSIRKVLNGSVGSVGSEDEITSFSYETEQTTVTNPLGGKSYYYYDQFGNALEEPATQEAAAEFYAGYAEIETEAARKDVDLQDHAAILDSQLSQQLGSNYTGEWFDPSTKLIKIGLTSEGYEQTVVQDLDALGLADNAEIVTESASWGQLVAAEEAMSASLGTLVSEGLVVLGIEPALDAATIEKANSLTAPQTKKVTEAVEAATVPVHVTEAATPSVAAAASACGSGVCDKPLRGGVAIEAEAEKTLWNCTSGFVARSISDNKPYVLTAGHCIKDAGVGNTWWSKMHEPLTKHNIGKAHSYFFGSSQSVPGGTSEKGDAGLVAIESTSFWANPLEPLVIVYGSGEAGTTLNERYGIIGTKYNPKESTPRLQFVVCSGGWGANLNNEGAYRQEEACGITQGFVSEVHYKGSETVHNLEKVNVCNSHVHELVLGAGSSGSPVYKNHFAYGVHSGYKGTCVFLYEGINTAESVLHVHILKE